MTTAWYIDALDARGGFAFTSFRGPDLLSSDLVLDAPCVFVSPPTFRSETVSSRAGALAATRGSFQLGLYLQQNEVAFPNLDAAIEFVRRAYLRGGGGDGPAGGIPGVPPRPEGGPEGESREGRGGETERIRGGDLPAQVLEYANALVDLAKSLKKPTPNELLETSVPPQMFVASTARAGRDLADVLGLGASELIFELISRFPVNGSNESIIEWLGSAERLGRAIAAMGLWQLFIASGPINTYLERIGRDFLERMSKNRRNLSKFRSLLPRAVDFPGRSGVHVIFALFFAADADWRWGPYTRLVALNSTDPVDNLTRWPVPIDTAALVGTTNVDSTSLYDLLCAVAGSPDVLIVDPSGTKVVADVGQRAVALIIFAAVHLTTATSPSPIPGTFLWSNELVDSALSGAVVAALSWLDAQFPRHVFPNLVEAQIRRTAALAYA